MSGEARTPPTRSSATIAPTGAGGRLPAKEALTPDAKLVSTKDSKPYRLTEAGKVDNDRSLVMSLPPSLSFTTNACIVELKTRARLALKALRAGDPALLARAKQASGRPAFVPQEWQLRHALAVVAQCVGFQHWEHARTVLGGDARAGEDMGRFWHAPGCGRLLNHWFARHDEALAFLRTHEGWALLPYARQFVVADGEYLQELRLSPQLADGSFDAVAEYGSPRWLAWCEARLRTSPAHWMR